MSGSPFDYQTVVSGVKAFSEKTKIPLEAITLGGGGALVLRGLRDSTQDLNIWVNSDHFSKLAEDNKVFLHPMRDKVINPTELPHCWIRKYNPYFETDTFEGIRCYNLISMITFKRGSYNKVERPLAKRKQDKLDLIALDEVFRVVNKVRA